MTRSCNPVDVCIGPFVVGEIPAPLQYQFLDQNGSAINVTGYAARFIYRPPTGIAVDVAATVTDGPNGLVTYVWTGTEFALTGRYHAEMWIGNGVQRFASDRITWIVRSPIGSVPNI